MKRQLIFWVGAWYLCLFRAEPALPQAALVNTPFPSISGYLNAPTTAPTVARTGAPSGPYSTVGLVTDFTNNSQTAYGYGQRHNWTTFTGGSNSSFEIGTGMIGNVLATHATPIARHMNYLLQWDVMNCPHDPIPDDAYACFDREIDITNYGVDEGWHPSRGSAQWTLGLQVVPTGYAGPTHAQNVLAGYLTARGGLNVGSGPAGSFLGFYNGFMCDVDSVAPAGYCLWANGDNTGASSNHPRSPFGADKAWVTGIRLDRATFDDNNAYVASTGQGLAWASSGAIKGRITGSASGDITFTPTSPGVINNQGPIQQDGVTIIDTNRNFFAATLMTYKIRNVSKVLDHAIAAKDSGAHFDNAGATKSVTFLLPAAAPGLNFCFLIMTAAKLEIRASAADRIYFGAKERPTTTLTGASIGMNECVEAHGLQTWFTVASQGAWVTH